MMIESGIDFCNLSASLAAQMVGSNTYTRKAACIAAERALDGGISPAILNNRNYKRELDALRELISRVRHEFAESDCDLVAQQKNDFALFIELGMLRDEFVAHLIQQGATAEDAFGRYVDCFNKAEAEAAQDFAEGEAEYQAARKAGF